MTDRESAYTSPRRDVAALVPRGARRVLELGCSTGATAAFLKERQDVEIVGIERDTSYAESAATVLDRVIIRDLNDPAWAGDLDGTFDCVLAADVLEHLVDPWSVLRRAARRLSPEGRVVLSLPNIRHIQSLVGLAVGRWPYRDRGVHDATHLRFFTLREIRGLCAVAGLAIESVARNYRFLDRPSHLDPFARLSRVTPLRELFTYQYLIRTRLAPEPVEAAPETVPGWTRHG